MGNAFAIACDRPEQDEPEDSLLVQRAVQDRDAFAAIYDRYQARVFQYLRLCCTTAEDATDLTNQVFLQAWRALPRYRAREGVPLIAWLLRIARNAAVDAARKRRSTVSNDLVPDVYFAGVPLEPEGMVLDREPLERLRAAIAGLDAKKRDLLALRFSAGLSAREIGVVVGKSEAAVQKQIFRTLNQLKEMLDE